MVAYLSALPAQALRCFGPCSGRAASGEVAARRKGAWTSRGVGGHGDGEWACRDSGAPDWERQVRVRMPVLRREPADEVQGDGVL